MADKALQPGLIETITQNVVYSLPGDRAVRIQSGAAVEVGLTNGTTGWSTLTNSNTVGAETSAPFVRCTSGNTTLRFLPV